MFTTTFIIICAIGRSEGGKRAVGAFKALMHKLAASEGTTVQVVYHTPGVNVSGKGLA